MLHFSIILLLIHITLVRSVFRSPGSAGFQCPRHPQCDAFTKSSLAEEYELEKKRQGDIAYEECKNRFKQWAPGTSIVRHSPLYCRPKVVETINDLSIWNQDWRETNFYRGCWIQLKWLFDLGACAKERENFRILEEKIDIIFKKCIRNKFNYDVNFIIMCKQRSLKQTQNEWAKVVESIWPCESERKVAEKFRAEHVKKNGP